MTITEVLFINYRPLVVFIKIYAFLCLIFTNLRYIYSISISRFRKILTRFTLTILFNCRVSRENNLIIKTFESIFFVAYKSTCYDIVIDNLGG